MSDDERHTAKRISVPDGANPGLRLTIWAIEPRGIGDAIRVALGSYDARVWVSRARVPQPEEAK